MRLLDQITAKKIRDGDVQAFESLMNKHKKTVFNYCLRIVSNYHQAEELTQEVFIKVYRNICSYNPEKASLSTWIYTITHNTCINNYRNVPLVNSIEQAELIDKLMSPEEQFLAKEQLDRLHQVIQTLTLEDRSIVIMKDYLGFKYCEISKIMKLPEGTVKSRLHSIRAKIRKLIGD